MEYTFAATMELLAGMGDEKKRKYNKKLGVNENTYGISLGNIRALAKKIKKDHALAFDLWKSGNFDAMILAAMLFDPKLLTENDFGALLNDAYIYSLVDELTFQTLCESKFAKAFMQKWILEDEGKLGRAGWNLATSLIMEDKLNEKDFESLLFEIEEKMKHALPQKQWAMNRCLCEIGIRYDSYTDRCLSIGERLGVYKDMKVSKGCTSAYALEWIRVGRAKRNK